MITEDDLLERNFAYLSDPYSGKMLWMHNNGEEVYDYNTCIVKFNDESNVASSVLGPHTHINKICSTTEDLDKFIEAIYFLEDRVLN